MWPSLNYQHLLFYYIFMANTGGQRWEIFVTMILLYLFGCENFLRGSRENFSHPNKKWFTVFDVIMRELYIPTRDHIALDNMQKATQLYILPTETKFVLFVTLILLFYEAHVYLSFFTYTFSVCFSADILCVVCWWGHKFLWTCQYTKRNR